MSFLFARQCIIKYPINYYFSSEGTFDFKKNCLFCDEVCDVEPDKKNPEKFKKKPGHLCRTADRGKDQHGRIRKPFKQVLEEVISKVVLMTNRNHDIQVFFLISISTMGQYFKFNLIKVVT